MESGIAVCNRSWGTRTKGAALGAVSVFAVLFLCLPAFSQGSFGRILGLLIVHEVAVDLVSRTDPKRSAIKIAPLRVLVFDASSPAIVQPP